MFPLEIVNKQLQFSKNRTKPSFTNKILLKLIQINRFNYFSSLNFKTVKLLKTTYIKFFKELNSGAVDMT